MATAGWTSATPPPGRLPTGARRAAEHCSAPGGGTHQLPVPGIPYGIPNILLIINNQLPYTDTGRYPLQCRTGS